MKLLCWFCGFRNKNNLVTNTEKKNEPFYYRELQNSNKQVNK